VSENEVTDNKAGEPPRHRIRLPGFITEEEIGVGDLVKRATNFAGVKPCGGCEKRAAALNRWMTFGPMR